MPDQPTAEKAAAAAANSPRPQAAAGTAPAAAAPSLTPEAAASLQAAGFSFGSPGSGSSSGGRKAGGLKIKKRHKPTGNKPAASAGIAALGIDTAAATKTAAAEDPASSPKPAAPAAAAAGGSSSADDGGIAAAGSSSGAFAGPLLTPQPNTAAAAALFAPTVTGFPGQYPAGARSINWAIQHAPQQAGMAAAAAAADAATAALLEPQQMEVDWAYEEDLAGNQGLWRPAEQHARELVEAEKQAAKAAAAAAGLIAEAAEADAVAAGGGQAAAVPASGPAAGNIASSSNNSSSGSIPGMLSGRPGIVTAYIKADTCPSISAAREAELAALGLRMPRPLAIPYAYQPGSAAAVGAAAAGWPPGSSSSSFAPAGTAGDSNRVSFGSIERAQRAKAEQYQAVVDAANARWITEDPAGFAAAQEMGRDAFAECCEQQEQARADVWKGLAEIPEAAPVPEHSQSPWGLFKPHPDFTDADSEYARRRARAEARLAREAAEAEDAALQSNYRFFGPPFFDQKGWAEHKRLNDAAIEQLVAVLQGQPGSKFARANAAWEEAEAAWSRIRFTSVLQDIKGFPEEEAAAAAQEAEDIAVAGRFDNLSREQYQALLLQMQTEQAAAPHLQEYNSIMQTANEALTANRLGQPGGEWQRVVYLLGQAEAARARAEAAAAARAEEHTQAVEAANAAAAAVGTPSWPRLPMVRGPDGGWVVAAPAAAPAGEAAAVSGSSAAAAAAAAAQVAPSGQVGSDSSRDSGVPATAAARLAGAVPGLLAAAAAAAGRVGGFDTAAAAAVGAPSAATPATPAAAAPAAPPAGGRVSDHMQSIARLMAIVGGADRAGVASAAAGSRGTAIEETAGTMAAAGAGAGGGAADGPTAGGARVLQEGGETRVILQDRGLAARLRALQQRCRAAAGQTDQDMKDAQ
jgi:hypothetical protein